MAWVHAVIALALAEYLFFGMAVARARARYGVHAPAITGNPDFERYYRVQVNTLELLVVFVPAMVLFAFYVDPSWAAGLGGVFVIGRAVYYLGYTRAAGRRHIGFALSMLPTMALLAGALIGALRALA
ncbi:MAG: MAPEG family protein [Steroidobacteraceae bacterium]